MRLSRSLHQFRAQICHKPWRAKSLRLAAAYTSYGAAGKILRRLMAYEVYGGLRQLMAAARGSNQYEVQSTHIIDTTYRKHKYVAVVHVYDGMVLYKTIEWAWPRGTPYVKITAMTSSGHFTSSVTSPIDSGRPLSYRLPIVTNLLSPVGLVSEIFSFTHNV